MLGDDHLHIDSRDQLSELISKAAKCAGGGALAINFSGEPAVMINADNGRIAIDILQAGIFRVPEDETSLLTNSRPHPSLAANCRITVSPFYLCEKAKRPCG